MKFIFSILIYLIFFVTISAHNITDDTKSLKGSVTDKQTGEKLIGVNIYLPDLKRGAVSDINGDFAINNLPSVKTTIQITYIGHLPIVKVIDLADTHEMNVVMDESDARIKEVVVTALTGNALVERTPSPISFISKSELLRYSSVNIIDAITQQPGISQISTGAGISKPVIRGLGFNRVVVVNDGIRQEGQQWGEEHGIEIDGQSVNSVEILKGPAGLMYGSDAMAGVINFQPPAILPEGKIDASFYSEYQTNNGLLNFSVQTGGNKNGYVWNWRYSDKRAHAYKNKYDGYVFNSGMKERALSGLLGLNKEWGYSHLTLSYYQSIPGIVEGERDDNTGKFIKPVIEDEVAHEAIASDKDGKTYKQFVPYQKIYHYKAVINNNIIAGRGNLKIIAGYQQNRRQEFEDVLSPDNYSLYFQLHTLNYDIRYNLSGINGYKMSMGINGMYQSSLNKGDELLLPEYNIFDTGIFTVISKNFGKLDISGGLRYDIRHMNVKEFEPHEHHHETKHHRGTEQEDHDEHIHPAFTKKFRGLSGSIGLTYQITEDWHTKLNFSRGFRSPNISELSAHGGHGGSIRYEIGNPNLKAENSWQVDLGIGYSSSVISGDLALFVNRINNYIFSEKLLDENGYDLITDGYKTYEFRSGNARIAGGEISIDFHPIERIHFQNSFSYVSSIQLNRPDSAKYLPFTPAPKFASDLRFDLIRHGKLFNNTYISFGLEHNFKQDKVYSVNQTETETSGYTLYNAGFGTDIVSKGRTIASFFVIANNLTNKAYQNHLSRLKYTDVNEVTGRQGVYNMGRNFSFKLIIPVNF